MVVPLLWGNIMKNSTKDEINYIHTKIDLKQWVYMLSVLLISALLYAFSVTCFINQSDGNIITAGISGIAMLIARVFFADNAAAAYSVIYIVMNIPIFLLGYKYIGKIFSILTLLNVVVASTLIGLINPSIYTFLDISGLEPITIALIAGVLSGCSIGVALKANLSTGGTDVISLFFGIKKGVSIGKYVILLNGIVVIMYGTYSGSTTGNWHSIFYTLCYIFVSSSVVDLIFTRTKKVLIEVITEKGNDISSILLQKTHHGCTLINGEGAFSHHGKQLLHMVVSVRQINEVVKLIKEIDSCSFVIQLPVDNIYGKFFIPPFR